MNNDSVAVPGFRTVRWAGWGHTHCEEVPTARPELLSRLVPVLPIEEGAHGIARGCGRSYADAALSSKRVINMTRMNRMLGFHDGRLTVEAGVSLADIIATWLPRGFFLPVTPGTRWVSVGGAIAADVHGKNHHVAGSIGQHVEELLLLTSGREFVRCSPRRHGDIFWATVGGMGLTGVIVEATIRLDPVETGYLSVDYIRTANLGATLEWFQEHDVERPYTVAWIDGISQGAALGRSVIMAGAPARSAELSSGSPAFPQPRSSLAIPCNLPSGVLNLRTGRLFNAVYYNRHPTRKRRIEPWWSFFYPLDGVDHWYRLYGRRGFCQYQAVFPPASSQLAVEAVLTTIQKAGQGTFLGVLKRMGAGSPGLLSFPHEGLTLAIDLPMVGPITRSLFQRLNDLTMDYGGRVYLAKDAWLTASQFRRMYPRWQEFLQVKAVVDPEGRWRSRLSERLGLGAGFE